MAAPSKAVVAAAPAAAPVAAKKAANKKPKAAKKAAPKNAKAANKKPKAAKKAAPKKVTQPAGIIKKLVAMEKQMMQNFDKVDQKLDKSDQKLSVSIAGCAQLAVLHITSSLIGSPVNARFAGAIATWSRVQHNGTVYAVGCAHCAFYYKSLGDHAFVSLPESITERAAKVLFFPSLLDPVQVGNPTQTDFVAVELNEALDPHLPVWGVPVISGATGAVAGRAHSCNVLGEGLLADSSEPRGFHGFRFVEQQGEAGNSGALMYAFKKDLTAIPLGVYCGGESQEQGMRCPGRICAFPAITDLVSFRVERRMENEGVVLNLMDRQGSANAPSGQGCSRTAPRGPA